MKDIKQILSKSSYLRIKVNPSAKENKIKEILFDEENGETIKISIKAAPEKNKANKELIKFLSQILNLEKNKIKILNGHSSQIKLIKIEK